MIGDMIKSFKEISWQVPESTYREDSALSYSTIAKFRRSGFNDLEHLFDRVESPSLTFGSAVDSIITGGEEEFNERFIVAEFPIIPDSIMSIVKALFETYSDQHTTLESIPDNNVIDIAASFNYQNNWKPETRAKVIKEKGTIYYKLLYLSRDKTLIDTDTYTDITNTVSALRTSDATSWYFSSNNPFDNIERLYQLKFKARLNGINYRCMADLLIIDHDKKVVIPVDLKTSSKPEWDFYKSFVDWRYDIQARLYWRIIRYIMDQDPYFKDFELLNYRFIVVNRKTLTPLVWECEFTKDEGLVEFSRMAFEDPETIGNELNTYLTSTRQVPIGVEVTGVNSLAKWLDK